MDDYRGDETSYEHVKPFFRKKEREYFKYQARQDYLREQRTIQKEHEQTAQQLEQASQQLEQTAKELQDSRLREEAAQKTRKGCFTGKSGRLG
nr:hypothetical protein [Methylocucumis oryzae]